MQRLTLQQLNLHLHATNVLALKCFTQDLVGFFCWLCILHSIISFFVIVDWAIALVIDGERVARTHCWDSLLRILYNVSSILHFNDYLAWLLISCRLWQLSQITGRFEEWAKERWQRSAMDARSCWFLQNCTWTDASHSNRFSRKYASALWAGFSESYASVSGKLH